MKRKMASTKSESPLRLAKETILAMTVKSGVRTGAAQIGSGRCGESEGCPTKTSCSCVSCPCSG